jgi:biopolymer transport protein ExbD
MFFLLLFFIILSTLVNPNVIKLSLPSSKSPSTLNSGKVTLAVDANHDYYVNNNKVPFDMLAPVLQGETKAKNTSKIILQLDKSLTVQDLADVMQIGNDLKLDMVLSVQKQQ